MSKTTKLIAIRLFDVDLEQVMVESPLYSMIQQWQEAYQDDLAVILDSTTSKRIAISFDSDEPVEISWFECEHTIQKAITTALTQHLAQVTGIADLVFDVNFTDACGRCCSAYFSHGEVAFVAYLDCVSVLFEQ